MYANIYRTMITIVSAILLAGCTAAPEPVYTPPVPEEPVTVSTGFALGADISWITEFESRGETFYNAAGSSRECTALMKEIGMNSIRLRVWVSPEQGWCNKSDVLAKAIRAKKLGMRIMIDFHYSDTWADPGRQLIPAAWLEYDTEALAEAVSEHTVEVLSLLKENDIDVEWVQVGNEVTTGMLYHTAVNDSNYGSSKSGYGGDIADHPENFAKFIDAGYKAVKSVYPDALAVVHVDRGNLAYVAQNVFNILEEYGAGYDIIGLSLYPYDPDDPDWMSSVESCVDNITAHYNRYGKEVMIVETGMPYDMADDAYNMLSTLISGARDSGHCLGVFYWEPEAPASSGYSLGAFENGAPTHALDAFTEAASEL